MLLLLRIESVTEFEDSIYVESSRLFTEFFLLEFNVEFELSSSNAFFDAGNGNTLELGA